MVVVFGGGGACARAQVTTCEPTQDVAKIYAFYEPLPPEARVSSRGSSASSGGDLCEDDEWRMATGLHPVRDYDFVVFGHGVRKSRRSLPHFVEWGRSERAPEGCIEVPTPRVNELALLVVSGKEREFLVGEQEIVGFLGEIDTPHEAALVVRLHGLHIYCGHQNFEEVPGGYRLQAAYSENCGRYGTVVVDVARAGQIVEHERVDIGDAGCIYH